MKIALLHLDVAEGPETRNGRTIISAAGEAVSRGADWIVTPETALQGYFFYDNNGKLPSFSEKQLSQYMFFAGRNKADMFLSAAEYDERDGKGYNSCFVINREGKFLGKHRKMFSTGRDLNGGCLWGERPMCLKSDRSMWVCLSAQIPITNSPVWK